MWHRLTHGRRRELCRAMLRAWMGAGLQKRSITLRAAVLQLWGFVASFQVSAALSEESELDDLHRSLPT